MKLRKIEAWLSSSYKPRELFATAAICDGGPFKSIVGYFDKDQIIATHPQFNLTVEDLAEMFIESDYEVIIIEAELDDGRIIYKHRSDPAEYMFRRRTDRYGKAIQSAEETA